MPRPIPAPTSMATMPRRSSSCSPASRFGGTCSCRMCRGARSVRSRPPISGTRAASAARFGRSRRCRSSDDGFHAFVGPALVPQGSSFGRNEGANNFVTHLRAVRRRKQLQRRRAPAGRPRRSRSSRTCCRSRPSGARHEVEEWLPGASPAPPPPMPYYLRFVVHDQPGNPGVHCGGAGPPGGQSRRACSRNRDIPKDAAALRHHRRAVRGSRAARQPWRDRHDRVARRAAARPARCSSGEEFVISFLFRVT